jgi:hypothetical protein
MRTGGHLGEIATMVGIDYLSQGDDFRLVPSLTNAVGLKIGLLTSNPAGMGREVQDLYKTAARVRQRGWGHLLADTNG